MSAVITGISIERGTCFDWVVNLTSGDSNNTSPYNLSGVGITGRIRRDFDSALQAMFETEILNAASGSLNLHLSSSGTNSLDLAPSHWDLFIGESGQCPIKLMTGPVYVSGDNWP